MSDAAMAVPGPEYKGFDMGHASNGGLSQAREEAPTAAVPGPSREAEAAAHAPRLDGPQVPGLRSADAGAATAASLLLRRAEGAQRKDGNLAA
jgi:hypothetical protein